MAEVDGQADAIDGSRPVDEHPSQQRRDLERGNGPAFTLLQLLCGVGPLGNAGSFCRRQQQARGIEYRGRAWLRRQTSEQQGIIIRHQCGRTLPSIGCREYQRFQRRQQRNVAAFVTQSCTCLTIPELRQERFGQAIRVWQLSRQSSNGLNLFEIGCQHRALLDKPAKQAVRHVGVPGKRSQIFEGRQRILERHRRRGQDFHVWPRQPLRVPERQQDEQHDYCDEHRRHLEACRQVFVGPSCREHGLVQTVTHAQAAVMIDLDEPDRHEAPLQRRTKVGRNLDTFAYPTVQIEQRLVARLVMHDRAVNMAHVRLAVQGRAACDLGRRNMINVFRYVADNLLPRHLASEFLAQVGLPPTPVKDAVQRHPGIVRAEVQFCSEQVELLAREILEHNRLRHAEWRQLRLRHQADRVALAEQDECQARKVGIRRTRVVCAANAGQQLVGKRQVFNTLNLVDEDDDWFRNELQDDFRIELEQALPVAQDGLVVPPGLQVVANAQLAQHSIGDVVIPAPRVRPPITDADLRKIENCNLAACCFKSRRRRGDQTGLATAVRRQHVGETGGNERFVKKIVCLALDVTGPNGMQWGPDTEELAGSIRLVPLVGRQLVAGLFAHAIPALQRPTILALFCPEWTAKEF